VITIFEARHCLKIPSSSYVHFVNLHIIIIIIIIISFSNPDTDSVPNCVRIEFLAYRNWLLLRHTPVHPVAISAVRQNYVS